MSYLYSLAGGVLIGLAASAMLLGLGRVAGISGMVGTVLRGPTRPSALVPIWFLAGIFSAGILAQVIAPQFVVPPDGMSTAELIAAGILVGTGVYWGRGCTSGHGVCGISRLSRRSIAATLSFMAAGALVANLVHGVLS